MSSLTPREYLDALGRLPQRTNAVEELPRLTTLLRRRLHEPSPSHGDGEVGDDEWEAAALAYMKHWSSLAVGLLRHFRGLSDWLQSHGAYRTWCLQLDVF